MKKLLYWQIGVVLLVATVFHLSILLGQEYKHALFGAAFAAAGATFFGIFAIGSTLAIPSDNPHLVRAAWPNICGLIAASSAAAMAFFYTMPYVGAAATAISIPFAVLAVWTGVEVVKRATAQGTHTGWRFFVSVLSLAIEVVLIAVILQPL